MRPPSRLGRPRCRIVELRFFRIPRNYEIVITGNLLSRFQNDQKPPSLRCPAPFRPDTKLVSDPTSVLPVDLKQLGYFVHVAELGSFTKAAAMLSVAQSALSHQVRQLEVELKQALLYRNGRGVTPTDAGKRLLGHARGILMQVDRARDELAETRGAPVGNVILGLPASIARVLTLPLLRSFRQSFPSASLGIVEGLSAYVIEWLVVGRVDIGLVYNAAPGPAVEIHPLHEQEMFLISAKGKAR